MADYVEAPPQIDFAPGGISYELAGALEGIKAQA